MKGKMMRKTAGSGKGEAGGEFPFTVAGAYGRRPREDVLNCLVNPQDVHFRLVIV